MYREVYSKYMRFVSEEPNASDEVQGYCPLHDDTNASFSFNVDTGMWMCFSCNKGGAPVQLISEVEGISLDTANKRLAELIAPATQEDVLRWQKILQDSSSALGYLSSRGIAHRETLAKYFIGYDGSRITIPIYDLDGNVVNVRRMATGKVSRGKVINIRGTDAGLWPLKVFSDGDAGPTYICAGETDCLSALIQGRKAITGTGGEGYWNDSWSPLFAGQDVIIAYDGDKAGRLGATKVAASLKKYVSSILIADIPDGEDINSLHCQGIKLADITTKHFEADYALALINSMKNLSVDERLDMAQQLVDYLATLPPLRQEHYLDLAKQEANLSKDALRKAMKSVAATSETPSNLPLEPAPVDAAPVITTLAIDYSNSIFHYGTWLSTHRPGEFVFRLVTSDKKLLPVPDTDDKVLPQQEVTRRWSIENGQPHNVFAWIGGKCDRVDGKQLFQELVGTFKRFMWYQDNNVYGVLALWVMHTYVFKLFDATPYLVLTGTKRSGKSRTLEILEELAYNAVTASSMSAAVLYRAIELNRHTVLLDESDILTTSTRSSGGTDERMAVLLQGYKSKGKVARIEGESLLPKWFYAFSPKAFASMRSLPEALVDRTIFVQILRKPVDVAVENLILSKEIAAFQQLRDELYCFSLENASLISDLRPGAMSLLEDAGVSDREEEIWHPLIAIALAMDLEIDWLVTYAKSSANLKNANEAETSFTNIVVQACYSLVESDAGPDDPTGPWYVRDRLRAEVALVFSKPVEVISMRAIAAELVRTGLVAPGGEDRKQFGKGELRGKYAYRLTGDKVLEAVKRYGVLVGEGIKYLKDGGDAP